MFAIMWRARPSRPGSSRDAQRVLRSWDVAEARRRVLDAGGERTGVMAHVFIALALDSGARKGELLGLRWSDLDLATGVMRIEQQLLIGWHVSHVRPDKDETDAVRWTLVSRPLALLQGTRGAVRAS